MSIVSRAAVAGVVLALAVTAPAFAASFNYPDFSSTAGSQLNGAAARSGNVLRLVPAQPNLAGSAFPAVKTHVRQFSTHFVASMHDATAAHADGFTFALQGVGPTALGATGGGLGYQGIVPSMAIEFDIFQNPEFSDPSANHVGVLLSGSANQVFAVTPPIAMYGTTLYVWIDFTKNGSQGETRVYLNTTDVKPANFVLGVGIVGGWEGLVGGDYAWSGFTAGTGTYDANHDILSWTLRDDDPHGSTTARGTLVGTAPLQFSSATDCDAPAATRPFIAEWNPGTGTKRFTKTALRTDTCVNNPAGYASPAGFNEQRGAAVGTISGPGYQGPGSVEFEFIDGGAGANPNDKTRIVIRDNDGNLLYQSPLQTPGPFNGTPGGVWTLAP
jgi:Legume lectin domain